MMRFVLASLMILAQGAFLYTASESLLIPALAGSVAVLGMLLPIPWPGNRSHRLLLVGGVVILSVSVAVLTRDQPPSGSDVLPRVLTIPVGESLLLVQAFAVIRARNRGAFPEFFPALTVLGCLCSFNQPLDFSERSTFLGFAIMAVCGYGLLTAGPVSVVGPARMTGFRRLVLAATIGGTAALSWAFVTGWEYGTASLQRVWPSWMARAAGHNRAARGYVRQGDLRSVTSEQEVDPSFVALRVYSDEMPGYLRSRVFDLYSRSRWQLSTERGNRWSRLDDKRLIAPLDSVPVETGERLPDSKFFEVDPLGAGPVTMLELHNVPDRGEVFFAPLNARFVEGIGDYVAVDEHDIIHAGISSTIPYRVYRAASRQRQPLSPASRATLISPLDGLDDRIPELADAICRDAASPLEKIDAILSFFRENFEYSTEGVTVPSGRDPISHFLLERPPAHCEYFASGAVALLRAQGIPARYVIGYVVTELDEYEEYWLARNRNAHAWVEAFDDSRQQWVIVEPTPGMSQVLQGGLLRRGGTGGTVQERDSASRRRMSRWWQGSDWLNADLWRSLGEYRAIGIGLTTCAVGVLLGLIWWSSRRNPNRRPTDMHRALARLERQLSRQNIVRRPDETLHQFSARLKHDHEDEWLRQVAEWFLHYACHRYSGNSSEALPPIPTRPNRRMRAGTAA